MGVELGPGIGNSSYLGIYRPHPQRLFCRGVVLSIKTLAGCAVAFVCAVAAEMLATSGLELIDWEASWAESGTAFAVGMIVAALLALAVLVLMKKKAEAK